MYVHIFTYRCLSRFFFFCNLLTFIFVFEFGTLLAVGEEDIVSKPEYLTNALVGNVEQNFSRIKITYVVD